MYGVAAKFEIERHEDFNAVRDAVRLDLNVDCFRAVDGRRVAGGVESGDPTSSSSSSCCILSSSNDSGCSKSLSTLLDREYDFPLEALRGDPFQLNCKSEEIVDRSSVMREGRDSVEGERSGEKSSIVSALEERDRLALPAGGESRSCSLGLVPKEEDSCAMSALFQSSINCCEEHRLGKDEEDFL